MVQKASLITEELKAMIGKELGCWTSVEPVSRSEIRRYTQAVMDDNPLFYDDEYAKRTRFGAVVAPGIYPARVQRRLPGAEDPLIEAGTDGDFTNVLVDWQGLWPADMQEFNSGSETEIFQYAQPGDIITARRTVIDVYEKKGKTGRLGFYIIGITYTNQKEEVLCIVRVTHVMREGLKRGATG